ncbi:MAG: hypothetical protein ACR2RB_01605 [Gammaproteobacteria bacterium]
MRFKVADDDGATLAEGRDLAKLQARLGQDWLDCGLVSDQAR